MCVEAVRSISEVRAVYLAAAREIGSAKGPDRVLLIVEVPSNLAHWVARAVATGYEQAAFSPRLPLELTIHPTDSASVASWMSTLHRAWKG